MATIMLQGKPVQTVGTLPKIGTTAPDFKLTKIDLSEVSLKNYLGKKVILSIFPSVDTGTCAAAMKHFNESATNEKDVVVLCISADLPFAQKRFCGAEHLKNVIPLSSFRHPEFGKTYGVTIVDGPLAGLLARAVIVINETGKVIYEQLVIEITQEPDYAAALKMLR